MFKDKRFTVEHAIGMFAYSHVYFPASKIYDSELLDRFSETIERCHLYFIGITPKVNIRCVAQVGQGMWVSADVAGEVKGADLPLPLGARVFESRDSSLIKLPSGQIVDPDMEEFLVALGGLPFEVLYIGQAYGRNGERNALDRLLEHKTLQEISLKGVPDDHQLTLLLLEVADNQIFTMFNPRAVETCREVDDQRISAGVDKLYGTTEAERISLYEAAMIRYFHPRFNVMFKDSFPSTNQKLLSDCYERDFSAVIAELVFDEFPFRLFSERVEPSDQHIVTFNLQTETDRHVFFTA